MAKENKFKKITDIAADVIIWHDKLQADFDRKMVKTGHHIVNCGAAVINAHDFLQAKVDRRWLIIKYHVAKAIHNNRKKVTAHKKTILTDTAAFILAAIAIFALFSHFTGYEYSYNGRALGIVKNQEDVLKLLDLVSDELTKEYGSNIQIDRDSNITFKRVSIVNQDVDNTDTVLKRLTYMSDMEAKAYAIFIDGKQFVTCVSKSEAKEVLKNIQEKYMNDDEDTEYKKIDFKEKVEIKEVKTKLAYISSVGKATKKILNGGSEGISYVVKNGDTFSGICSKYDISFNQLKAMNKGIKADKLYPGDKLIINKSTSALTVITIEKSTYAEKVKYTTVYRKSKSMYKGDSKVIQKGVNGKRVVTAVISRENGKVTNKKILKTETLKKSVRKIVVKGTKTVPKTAPTGHYIIPVSGYTMTSPFGYRWGRLHEGVDLACPTGTTIRASDGGTVVYAGWYCGYGLMIEINHGNGVHTRYGHCSAINVSVGQKVYQGEKIGEVGNTGNSYGSHCHFEVRVNNSPVNPMSYV